MIFQIKIPLVSYQKRKITETKEGIVITKLFDHFLNYLPRKNPIIFAQYAFYAKA